MQINNYGHVAYRAGITIPDSKGIQQPTMGLFLDEQLVSADRKPAMGLFFNVDPALLVAIALTDDDKIYLFQRDGSFTTDGRTWSKAGLPNGMQNPALLALPLHSKTYSFELPIIWNGEKACGPIIGAAHHMSNQRQTVYLNADSKPVLEVLGEAFSSEAIYTPAGKVAANDLRIIPSNHLPAYNGNVFRFNGSTTRRNQQDRPEPVMNSKGQIFLFAQPASDDSRPFDAVLATPLKVPHCN